MIGTTANAAAGWVFVLLLVACYFAPYDWVVIDGDGGNSCRRIIGDHDQGGNGRSEPFPIRIISGIGNQEWGVIKVAVAFQNSRPRPVVLRRTGTSSTTASSQLPPQSKQQYQSFKAVPEPWVPSVLSQQQPTKLSSTAAVTSDVVHTNTTNHCNQRFKFMYMTQAQDEELQRLGNHEAMLMNNTTRPQQLLQPTPLLPPSLLLSSSSSLISERIKKRKSKLRRSSTSYSSANGFGSAKSKTRPSTCIQPEMVANDRWRDASHVYASVLKREGLVCIEHLLTSELCNQLRDYLIDLRDRSRADIESGKIMNSQDRFADVLLNQNRCDLKIPLGPRPVNQALHYILASDETVLSDLIRTIYSSNINNHNNKNKNKDNIDNAFHADVAVGDEATLYELNCFMSQSGARRQLVHADNLCVDVDDVDPEILDPDAPIMLTCFIALQDVNTRMGPTAFIPRTHNAEAHRQFFATSNSSSSSSSSASSLSSKDQLLRDTPAVLGTLAKGSGIVFDPRVLHCATANTDPDVQHTRALFYVSFKHPFVDSPGCPSCGGYGIPQAELSLRQIIAELQAEYSPPTSTTSTSSTSVGTSSTPGGAQRGLPGSKWAFLAANP